MRTAMFKKILIALLFAPLAALASEALKLDRAPDRATDQAALHGVLNKIRDLGLPIISVQLSGPQ